MAKAKEEYATTTPKQLKNLIGLYNKTKQGTAELSGELGDAIRQAVENQFLNRKAFNMIKPLLKLEPEKLADVMDAFLYYYDVSGLQARAKSAPKFEVIEGGAHEEELEAAE